jgi:pilus assembly protein CpaB
MRKRAGLLVAMALVSGTLAAFLAFTFLRAPSMPAAFGANESVAVPVVVAARDLTVGTTLAAEDVKVVSWPGNAQPAGFATSTDEVIGLGVLVPVAVNEPLLPQKMASADQGRGLSMLVPQGYRAVSVPVNDVVAVAGWVRPGTRVDVMVTLNDVRNEVEPITQTVLQNVTVLGNDRTISTEGSGQASQIAVVTLLVTPEDAEKLAMAESHGRLQLALRNGVDLDTASTPGVRTSGLIRRPAPAPGPVTRRAAVSAAPAAPPRPKTVTIEIIRGQQRTESTVPAGEVP